MALKFYAEDDIVKTETMLITLYGDVGIGKTSLSFTTANPLLLDFDMGVQRCVGRKHFVRIDSWNDIRELQVDPRLRTNTPSTLILDTGGTMLDNYGTDYIKGLDPKNSRGGGELSLNGYGALKGLFKQFKDWCRTLGVNVIFICHSTADKNKEGKVIPQLTGGSLDLLRRESDLIGYVHSFKDKRFVDFRPIDSHDGKDCAQIGMIEIPDASTPEYKMFFQGVIDRTLEKMNELTESQQKTIKIISDYRDGLAKIKTVKAANDLIKKLMDEKKPIQIQVFIELKEHCDNTKCALYDAKDKKFVKHV